MLYAKRFLETRRKQEHAICNHRHNQKLLRLGLDITKMAPDNSTTVSPRFTTVSTYDVSRLRTHFKYSALGSFVCTFYYLHYLYI